MNLDVLRLDVKMEDLTCKEWQQAETLHQEERKLLQHQSQQAQNPTQ
jgi:hypothetical protein